MSDPHTVKVLPPALPTKIEDWVRKLKSRPTLNDMVEEIHKMLITSEETGGQYIPYLNAVDDSQAVEGSLSTDDVMAATMIREKANTIDGHALQREKLATITRALRVVLRRYNLSRKERRQTVDGQVVPDNNSGDY